MSTLWSDLPHDHPLRCNARIGRVVYAPTDFVTLLWRELPLMILVFLFVVGLGFAVALSLKKTYTASSSLFVRLGQEYVYEPRAGDAGRGAVPDINTVVQAETEILNSAELRDRVIREMGLASVFPDLAKKYAAAALADRPMALVKAREAMGKALKVDAAPDNAIVRISYQAKDPDVALRVLNTLLNDYMTYRLGLLIAPDERVLERQRGLYEDRLATAEKAYQDFLMVNGIGDFNAEKAALIQVQSQVETQRYAAETRLQDRTARLASIQSQLRSTPAEVVLFRDASTVAADKLVGLKLERESLLSRYRPDAQSVKDIEAQIAQLQAGFDTGRTNAPGTQRTGINPVYQTLQSTWNDLAAEVAALRGTVRAYRDQAGQVNLRLQKLAALEPRFIALSRDRDLLQAGVRDFTVRQQQDHASRQIAGESNDNIRVVQRATVATNGKSLRKTVLALALIFSLFAALCVGLIRMFLRPGVRTAESAALTLELPVLAKAGLKY